MINYFELFDLPISFHPPLADVKKRYYELSRTYHPDRATADNQTDLLQQSALVNEAYKTLRDADATMAHILRLHRQITDEEQYSLPPAFLMEMMDLNENVSDMEDNPDNKGMAESALEALNAQLQTWQTETDAMTAQYEAGNITDLILLQIKDMYFRKKYLLRIQQRIDTFAAR